MKWVVDNQLPVLLAAYLRGRGHECMHVIDVGLDAADDMDVWAYGLRKGAVVISKDGDFVALAARPGDVGRLLWVRLGNCRNLALLAAFDRLHDNIIAAFDAGQRIVEIR